LGKERSALAARYTVKNTIFQSTDAKALLFPQIDSMSECLVLIYTVKQPFLESAD
jgi:hypothetical protein